MIWMILLIIAVITALVLVSPFSSSDRKTKTKSLAITGAMALCIVSSLGLYAMLGTPTPPQPEILAEQEIEPPDVLGMVNGLAERLIDDPEDAEGWAQLIRSRLVLGQSAKLIDEHKIMVEHYKDRPEIIEKINEQSGLNDLIVDSAPE